MSDKVELGSVPYRIMGETLDMVNEHGFTLHTMELLLKASNAAEKTSEAIEAVNDLKQAQQFFLDHLEGPDNIENSQ